MTSLRVSPEPTPSGSLLEGRLRLPGWVRGCGPAAAVLLSTYAAVASGVMPAGVSVALLLALLVAVPTSPLLAVRVAANGVCLISLAPVLWWVRWPVQVNHGALLVAGAAAGVAGWLTAGAVKPRLRVLLPTPTYTDVLIPAAGVLAAVTMHRWLLATSPVKTLAMMLGNGYDNAAHFDIFSMILRHGVTLDLLGRAPDGSPWALQYYPQGFHGLAATYAELTAPGVASGPPAVVVYAHAVAAIVLLGVMVLVAALCAMPTLGCRPLVAAPAAVVICAAFLWSPGGKALSDGFGNFWLAALMGACAMLLAVGRPRQPSPLHWSAIGLALLAVAHSWAPLLLVAAPALLVAAPVRGHRTETSRRARWVSLVALAACALGVLKAVWLLHKVGDMADVVSAVGGITPSSPVPALALVALSLAVFGGFHRYVARDLSGARGTRLAERAALVRRMSLSTLAGVLSLTALLLMQLVTLHASAYYFTKYLVGFELVIAAATVGTAAMCVGLCRPRLLRRRALASFISLALSVVATQSLGHVGWHDVVDFPLSSHVPRTADTASSTHATALRIIRASTSASADPGIRYTWAGTGHGREADGTLSALWFHALTGTMTQASERREHQPARATAVVPAPLVS